MGCKLKKKAVDFNASTLFQVRRDEPPKDWRSLGGLDLGDRTTKTYVFKSMAKTGDIRFEAAPVFDCDEAEDGEVAECCNCVYRDANADDVVLLNWHDGQIEDIQWKGTRYEAGDCVLVDPEEATDPWAPMRKKPPTLKQLLKQDGAGDKPELVRKGDNRNPKGYVKDNVVPLRVAQIVDIQTTKKTQSQRARPEQVKVTLRYFERVDEDVDDEYEAKMNPNGLRWSKDGKKAKIEARLT
jgi:hypothetical protein